MVDERHPEVGRGSPVTAPDEGDDGEEVPDVEAEADSAAEKSPAGRSASPSPSTGSGVPRSLQGLEHAPPAGLGARGAPGDDPERRIEAGTHRSDVCPPLWKVCLHATPPNHKPYRNLP